MSQVSAKFEITYNQFINEKGEATQALPEWTKDHDLLRRLYSTMVLTRTFDTKAINLQRTGKMGTYPSTLGQEAISVGYGAPMESDDVLAPYYRDYGAQFWHGVELAEIYRYWGGDERGSNFANRPDDFPISVPIASQVLYAAGAAKAFQYRDEKRVVVTSVGDGATSEGDFYEALNVAGVWKLPMVFVIINNQWAISVPLSIQTSCETLAQKGIAANVPGEQVDGNDIIAVYESTRKALARARQGEGASVIEMISYRLCDHTTADDASRYRSQEELDQAWQREPIARMKTFLEGQGIWDESQEQALLADCKQQVNQAVEDYVNTPKQGPEAMFDFMYANLPESLKEQRQLAIDLAQDKEQ